jgi:hypothetical protein
MRSRCQDGRRTLLSIVLAVVLVSPALAGGKQPDVEGELTFAFLDLEGRTQLATEGADGGTTEPLWQFETGG